MLFSFSPPYGPKLLPVVAYAPNNSIFDKLIKDMKNLTQYDLTYIPIDSAENLEALLKRNRSIIAGILFNHPDVSCDELWSTMVYLFIFYFSIDKRISQKFRRISIFHCVFRL